MDQRLPFYMVYQPEWDIWSEENISRRDYEYMKSIYPDIAKRIMPYVEEECDRMEYSGSMMFDEYPDRLQLRLLCRRIYDKVKNGWMDEREKMEQSEDQWIWDLIQVMTYQEILKRRKENRNYRRRYY